MSSLLSAADLAACQATVALHLPSTASVQTNTPASDSQGGATDSWATTASLACKVLQKQPDASERVEGSAPKSETEWDIQFAAGSSIIPKQRLVIDSVTYEVMDVDTGQSNGLALTATCRKLT